MDGACQPGVMTDVVSSGGEPAGRRTRALLVAAVVLVLLAGAADRWWADRERARLRAAVLAGEATVGGSSTSLTGLAAYSSRLLHSADISPGVRRSAYDNLGQDAARWAPRVQVAQQRVLAIDVLPWHSGLHEARQAYGLRLQAWAEVLSRFADDPQTGVGDPDVTQARVAARDALRAAGLDLLG